MTPEAFRDWAIRLGLVHLTEPDLESLRRGWLGLAPQLARLRAGLAEADRPAQPSLR